jgi:AcrR family transcriptional regulator
MTEKRADILAATLQLISEHGFHGTPMSKVAEQAGVGAGTIYRYFASKEDLIQDLFLEIKREFTANMLTGFDPTASIEQTYRRVWQNTFEYSVQNPEKMVFLEQFHNSPFHTPETEAVTREYLAPMVSVFQAAIETKQIKPIPFEMMTIFAYDLTIAFAKRQIAGTLEMDEDHLKMALQASWDAIKIS